MSSRDSRSHRRNAADSEVLAKIRRHVLKHFESMTAFLQRAERVFERISGARQLIHRGSELN